MNMNLMSKSEWQLSHHNWRIPFSPEKRVACEQQQMVGFIPECMQALRESDRCDESIFHWTWRARPRYQNQFQSAGANKRKQQIDATDCTVNRLYGF